MYVYLKKADQLDRVNKSEMFSLKNRTVQPTSTRTRRLTIPMFAQKFRQEIHNIVSRFSHKTKSGNGYQ